METLDISVPIILVGPTQSTKHLRARLSNSDSKTPTPLSDSEIVRLCGKREPSFDKVSDEKVSIHKNILQISIS